MEINDYSNIPGYATSHVRKFAYIEIGEPTSFDLFLRRLQIYLKTRMEHGSKPLSGAVVDEAVRITLPNGRCFRGISYRGDIADWDAIIKSITSDIGTRVAGIENRMFSVDDGCTVNLSECVITQS